MGEHQTPRTLAAAPWRAALNDDESRAYLQSRLITLSSLMYWSFVAFLVYVTILYKTGLANEPRSNFTIFVVSDVGLVLLAVLWRLMVRRPLPIRVLNVIDAFYAFGTGALLAFGGYMAPDFRPAPYACLLFTCLIVLTRAIMIPSSGRRTITMSIVAFAPFAAAGVAIGLSSSREFTDLSPAATICSVTLICAVVTSLAASGSQTLYGLRQRVHAATQLGQYRLDEKIGEGGMGAVYRAHHMLLRRPTAVKLLLPDRIGADTVDRFEREVKHMSRLTHPNTVAIYDFGRSHDGVFYYAMEYLDGIDLSDLVTEFGRQPPNRVIDILVQVCGAMQEAHDLEIVHRDIKPANIILCERGGMADVAKVVDFGLVKRLSAQQEADDANLVRALTVDSQLILGTPGYLAPEAITRPQEIGTAADIYALGAVAYYLLAGRRIFEGGTALAICLRHVTDEVPLLSTIAGIEIPADLEAVVMQCLAKEPAARPTSASALATQLRALPRTGAWDEPASRAWWSAFRGRVVARRVTDAASLTIEVDLGNRVSVP